MCWEYRNKYNIWSLCFYGVYILMETHNKQINNNKKKHHKFILWKMPLFFFKTKEVGCGAQREEDEAVVESALYCCHHTLLTWILQFKIWAISQNPYCSWLVCIKSITNWIIFHLCGLSVWLCKWEILPTNWEVYFRKVLLLSQGPGLGWENKREKFTAI